MAALHPKAAQVVVGWVAAWPTLTLILFLIQPFTHSWPLPLRALASATGMSITMNLVSVPLARRLLAPWLGQMPGSLQPTPSQAGDVVMPPQAR